MLREKLIVRGGMRSAPLPRPRAAASEKFANQRTGRCAPASRSAAERRRGRPLIPREPSAPSLYGWTTQRSTSKGQVVVLIFELRGKILETVLACRWPATTARRSP